MSQRALGCKRGLKSPLNVAFHTGHGDDKPGRAGQTPVRQQLRAEPTFPGGIGGSASAHRHLLYTWVGFRRESPTPAARLLVGFSKTDHVVEPIIPVHSSSKGVPLPTRMTTCVSERAARILPASAAAPCFDSKPWIALLGDSAMASPKWRCIWSQPQHHYGPRGIRPAAVPRTGTGVQRSAGGWWCGPAPSGPPHSLRSAPRLTSCLSSSPRRS